MRDYGRYVANTNAIIGTMMQNAAAIRAARTGPTLAASVLQPRVLLRHQQKRCGDYCGFCFTEMQRMLGRERLERLSHISLADEVPF